MLNLLLLGSRGQSYLELKKTLHYSQNITDLDIHQGFKTILESIQPVGSGVEVSTSSRLYVQEGLTIVKQFIDLAKNSYKSELLGLNFARDPVAAMNSINKWVESSTGGKIKDLVSRPFPPTTKLVAANVIYFNGEWENPFIKELTNDQFFDTGRKNVSVPMMSTLMTVPFLKGDTIGFDMVGLPYKGGKYAMYILTPTGKAGIQSIQRMEHVLNSYTIDQLINRMTTQLVHVMMPRMKLANKFSLKSDLRNLGLKEIFDPKRADLGRLTTQNGIYVDDILHEAIMEITETGTVAAAATAATFNRIGGNERFIFNKPSLLFIRDTTNNLVLFWARVLEPEPIFTQKFF